MQRKRGTSTGLQERKEMRARHERESIYIYVYIYTADAGGK